MAQSVERKLTTILCADVHGYLRLMEQDEPARLATLQLYPDALDGLVARHRGRIVSTAGDSSAISPVMPSRRTTGSDRRG